MVMSEEDRSPTCGSGFAGVDMADDDDVDVYLFFTAMSE